MQFFSDIGNTLTNTVQNFGSNITSIGSSVLSIVNPQNISNTLNYSSQFIQPVTSILQANPISTVQNIVQPVTSILQANPISTVQNIVQPVTSSSSNLLSSITNSASSLLSTGTSIVSSVGSTASSLLSGNTLLYIGAILLLLFLLK